MLVSESDTDVEATELPSMLVTRALPFIVVAGRVSLTTTSPSSLMDGWSLITPRLPVDGTDIDNVS